MPIAERGPTLRTAVSSPWRTSFHRWSTSQNRRSPSLVGTGTTLFEKRRISVRERRPSAMVPTMTRPEEAPRSTAPMWTGVASDMREPFGCLVSGVDPGGVWNRSGGAGAPPACPAPDPSGTQAPQPAALPPTRSERTRSRYPESRKARIGSGASPWDSRSSASIGRTSVLKASIKMSLAARTSPAS